MSDDLNLTDEQRQHLPPESWPGAVAWRITPADEMRALLRTISDLRTQLAKERATSSSLWQALVPFAAGAARAKAEWHDASNCETLHDLRLTLGHLRRARDIVRKGE